MGIRYRYYVSLPCLHGEAKTAKVGSVTRVPAADKDSGKYCCLMARREERSGRSGRNDASDW